MGSSGKFQVQNTCILYKNFIDAGLIEVGSKVTGMTLLGQIHYIINSTV